MTRELIDLPMEMKNLPRDKRGFPVPEFVAWFNGEPDFRVIKPGYFMLCVKNNLCWLCGCKLGSRKWFIAGPMCTVTRTVSEPPMHRLCAEFAVKNCPFMTKPMARRRGDLPPGVIEPPGEHITRNPGVVAIWETLDYRVFDPQLGQGYLITMGEAKDVTFWREARRATRAEVRESVESGLPRLIDSAVRDGEDAVQELTETTAEWVHKIFDRFLPEVANG